MKLRGLGLLLCSLLVPACGGGSSSGPIRDLLSIRTRGGAASSGSSVASGNSGGKISAFATGNIQFASADSSPDAPPAPDAPETGTELTNAMITAGTPVAGNILISSTLQIAAGVSPAVITSSTGDVVVRGSLIGERSAGTATRPITINAPAGTIYVLGLLQTSGTPGVVDNPDGGAVVLNAQRVVVRGTVDTRGETSGSGAGGKGGALTIDCTGAGGDDILHFGEILTRGGDGTTQGGKGGDVTLHAGDLLAVYGPVTAGGGEARHLTLAAIGGVGGALILRANGSVDVVAELSVAGGAASGFLNGASGGNGGSFLADSAVRYRVYGAIVTEGGAGSTNQPGGAASNGGAGGTVSFGVGTPTASLELGRGTYDSSGSDAFSSGGSGGDIEVESRDGHVTVGGSLDARGGDSNGSAAAGNVSIKTDAHASGNTVNHTLTTTCDINVSGGDGSGTPSQGGNVTLRSGGNLLWSGSLVTSGSANFGNGGAVSMVVAAVNQTPTGLLSVSGSINTEGSRGGPVNAGSGGAIQLTGVSDVTVQAVIRARGGGNGGGAAGSVTIQSLAGSVTLSGSIDATADPNFSATPPLPGDVVVSAFGSLSSSMKIDASAKDARAGNSNAAGAPGGTVSFTVTGPAGAVALLPGTWIRADGGASNEGSLHRPGGAGGSILVTTVDQPVTLNGTYSARGGATGDSNAAGGAGGQVVVNSDSDSNGVGGSITLTKDSKIDVSAGLGVTGGSARNNGGVAPAGSGGGNLAVVFDAAGGFGSSPDGAGVGVVQNLGQIIATGFSILGRGGDVWFDGRDLGGSDLGPGDLRSATLTGPAGSGVFFPN